MKKELLFNTLQIAYNDEFRAMTAQELKAFFGDDLNRWGVRYPEQHLVVSVGEKKLGVLAGVLSEPKGIIRGAESRFKRSLLDYQRIDEAPVWIDGQQAERLRFSYSASDANGKPAGIRQSCELIVIKLRKCIYSVYFMYRSENKNEAKAQFDSILQSLRFQ